MSRRGWVGMRWAGLCLAAVIVTATQATPAGAKTHADAKISAPLLALAQAKPKDEFAVIVRAASRLNNGHHSERAAAAVRRAQGKVGRGLSIVGGAFGWRALARELAGKIPLGGGLIPKGAIAYAGTVAVGKGLEFFYRTRRNPNASERAEIYDRALAQGNEAAAALR